MNYIDRNSQLCFSSNSPSRDTDNSPDYAAAKLQGLVEDLHLKGSQCKNGLLPTSILSSSLTDTPIPNRSDWIVSSVCRLRKWEKRGHARGLR